MPSLSRVRAVSDWAGALILSSGIVDLGRHPRPLPEHKMPDRHLEKQSKQREELASKKREASCAGPNYFCSRISQF